MEFFEREPNPVTSWRMAILMGANSRTYKFALGSALLQAAQAGRESIPLGNLAVAYALELANRGDEFRQAPGTTRPGPADFLTVLGEERSATLELSRPTERLIEAATRSMPGMVMQKFHNMRGIGEVPHRFYRLVGSGRNHVVELSPDLARIAEHQPLLTEELTSRWSIVERSFASGIGRSLVEAPIVLGDDGETLVTSRRRASVTTARFALSGFQHGRCFYCNLPLSEAARAVHVDHVYPYSLMTTGAWPVDGPDLNGVWNLVVACSHCNQAKANRLPEPDEISALLARNERIVLSPHPLRRTLELSMTASRGAPARSSTARKAFVQQVDLLATDLGLVTE